MNSKLKRTITIILALIMVFSLCLPAMAEEQKKPVYLCLGDSIGSGAALTYDGNEFSPQKVASFGSWEQWLTYSSVGFAFQEMPNAYHSLVAKSLGADLVMGARSAMRTTELRCLLGGGFNDFDPDYTWYNIWKGDYSYTVIGWQCNRDGFNDPDFYKMLSNGYDFEDYYMEDFLGFTNKIKLAQYENYAEAIKDADVISLNFGANDVFSTVLVTVLMKNAEKLSSVAGGAQVLADVLNMIKSGDLSGAYAKLKDANELIGEVGDFAAVFTKELNTAKKYFKENYKWIVNKIHELNPDATVVGLGVFNMLNYGKLPAEMGGFDMSVVLESTVNEINSFIRSLAYRYANYCYADISDTETHSWTLNDAMGFIQSGSTEAFLAFMMNLHPTLNGHRYIANQILNAIPEEAGGYSSSRLLDLFESSFIFKFMDSIVDFFTKGIEAVFNFGTSGFTYVSPFIK